MVLTDGRPWYKQVVSGIFKGALLALILTVSYNNPKLVIVMSGTILIFCLIKVYIWSTSK